MHTGETAEAVGGGNALFRDNAEPSRARTAASSAVASIAADEPVALRTVAARGAGYVPEVDALRAIAMSMVALFHCRFLPLGWMGVWLFFVISGFSVCTCLLASTRHTTSTRSLIQHFYARRCLRIWPLYFSFIALNVVFLIAAAKTRFLGEVPYQVVFLYNLKTIFTHYTDATRWSSFMPLWTLSVEQQFYLLFPLLFMLRTRRDVALALALIVLLSPIGRWMWGSWAYAHLGEDGRRTAFAVYAFAPVQFDAFAVGALIALFRSEISKHRRWMKFAVLCTLVGTLVYVGVYLAIDVSRAGVASIDGYRNIVSGVLYGQCREAFVYMLPTAGAAFLLMALLSKERISTWVCRLPGFQAIGRISYGAYLFQIPVLAALSALVPAFAAGPTESPLEDRIALLLCAYPIIVGLAWLSYHQFERRFQKAGKALMLRRT